MPVAHLLLCIWDPTSIYGFRLVFGYYLNPKNTLYLWVYYCPSIVRYPTKAFPVLSSGYHFRLTNAVFCCFLPSYCLGLRNATFLAVPDYSLRRRKYCFICYYPSTMWVQLNAISCTITQLLFEIQQVVFSVLLLGYYLRSSKLYFQHYYPATILNGEILFSMLLTRYYFRSTKFYFPC